MRANPPLDLVTEDNTVAQITRAGEVINELNKTSTEVESLKCQLKEDMSENDRIEIQNRLRDMYKEALCQDGFSLKMATSLVVFLVRCTEDGILVVLAERGKSIIIFCLCNTVKALDNLRLMIVSGFMRDVFTDIISLQTRTPTTVDVRVRDDDIISRRSCLTSQQDKGWLFDRQLLILNL